MRPSPGSAGARKRKGGIVTKEEIALALTLEVMKKEPAAPGESCIYSTSNTPGYHVDPARVVSTFNLLYSGLMGPGEGKE
jgi:hypothetical protein